MYHDFLGPRGLQGTHIDTLKLKNSKLITFTVRGGFFTFWAILAHSAAPNEAFCHRRPNFWAWAVFISKSQIPIYLGLELEFAFGPQRILDSAIVCGSY